MESSGETSQDPLWAGGDDVIFVPGRSTLLQTHAVSPLPVRLPIQAQVRRASVLRIGAFAGIAGTTCLLGSMTLAWSVLDRPSWKLGVVSLVMSAGPLATACYVLALGYGCARELLHPSPPITVETERLTVGHARICIPWSSVASVRLMRTRGGVRAVRLLLRTPVDVHRRTFLFDWLGVFRRSKSDELQVPVVARDVHSRVLAEAIVCLVRKAGGRVESPGMLL